MGDPYGLVGLTALTLRGKGAFAAACAERLLPLYAEYVRHGGTGDETAVRGALAALWAELAGEPAVGDLEAIADDLEGRVPDADEDHELSGYAEASISAVIYAIRTYANEDPESLRWASEMPVQAIDDRLLELADWDASRVDQVGGPHPAIVRERRRQARDIEALAEAEAAGDLAPALAEVRARAGREPISVDWPE
jgi:uncharacterized protein YjaG (DUF416 family)